MEWFNPRKMFNIITENGEDYEAIHEIRQRYYFDRLLYKLMTRFTYSGLPDTIRPELMEAQLLLNGTVGIAEGSSTGGLVSYVGHYGTDIDAYGLGSNYVGTDHIQSFDKKIGTEVVVGLNNIARLPECYFIDRYAKMLGSVDESLYIQLLASRDTPVVEVEDDVEKAQYEKAQKEREKGKPAVFVRPKRLSSLTGEHPTNTNVLQPNNSGIIETLDNLNSMHDDLMKRFFLEAGINISSKDKKAQLTVTEVDSYNDYSLINITDAFECRKKMIEEVNALFGLNASVELSEPYKEVVDNYYNEADETADETSDDRGEDSANEDTTE